MTKLSTVEIYNNEVTPLALGILELSVNKGVNKDSNGVQLVIDRNILRKIKQCYPGGMSDYLEQKVKEYVQCLIFGNIIEILSGKKVSIQMQYFQNDLLHGRDALMGNGNRERIALDVTNPKGIYSKIEKNNTIQLCNREAESWGIKNHYPEERLGKLAVGIPSKLTGIALGNINTDEPFNPNIIHTTVHSIISSPNNQGLINNIQVIGLNKKGSYQFNEMLQH